jgi:hypothetical protein
MILKNEQYSLQASKVVKKIENVKSACVSFGKK